ncbi:unnamed protein product, partial [Rotaria sp. Silwood1]
MARPSWTENEPNRTRISKTRF